MGDGGYLAKVRGNQAPAKLLLSAAASQRASQPVYSSLNSRRGGERVFSERGAHFQRTRAPVIKRTTGRPTLAHTRGKVALFTILAISFHAATQPL